MVRLHIISEYPRILKSSLRGQELVLKFKVGRSWIVVEGLGGTKPWDFSLGPEVRVKVNNLEQIGNSNMEGVEKMSK